MVKKHKIVMVEKLKEENCFFFFFFFCLYHQFVDNFFFLFGFA